MLQIIDLSKVDSEGKIVFGATIELLDLETDETIVIKFGDDEAMSNDKNFG